MHASIAEKREELAEICRRYDVERLEVFGSAASGADFDPKTSDADFLVKFRLQNNRASIQQYFGFAKALSQTLDCPIDLVESDAIQNPYLRITINKSCELVYES